MTDYGLKISQDGYDVKTATAPQLVLSSGFSTMPIFLQGTANQSISGFGTYTFTIAHGLSYTPFALVYYMSSAYSAYWTWVPDGGVSFLGSSTSTIGGTRVDSTNLMVRFSAGNTNPETITIKYFVFAVSV